MVNTEADFLEKCQISILNIGCLKFQRKCPTTLLCHYFLPMTCFTIVKSKNFAKHKINELKSEKMNHPISIADILHSETNTEIESFSKIKSGQI